MRTVKPQALLLQTMPFQLGALSYLGVSVGHGFRLSDTRILAHELAVREAFAAAPMSVREFDLALPKAHAEWLLAGHTTAPDDSGRDWPSHISLAGTEKALLCSAEAPHSRRLAIDHPQAIQDVRANTNPVGREKNPPLQRAGGLGRVADPLAATTPLHMAWATRSRWQPTQLGRTPGPGESLTSWPAHTDHRLFQQAAPDQWHANDTWPKQARFELSGFGEQGTGWVGQLPGLHAQVAVRRRQATGPESVALKVQTVWFFPDRSLGVVWSHGAVAMDGVLSDEVELLVAALTADTQSRSAPDLMLAAERRGVMTVENSESLRDHTLMPEGQDWTWEVISNQRDHPFNDPTPRNFESTRERLKVWTEKLDAADAAARSAGRESTQLLASLETALALKQLVNPPADQERALHALHQSQPLEDTEWGAVTIRGVPVKDRTWRRVRVEGADLRGMNWQLCQWEDVTLVNCNLEDVHWEDCSLQRVTFDRCRMHATRWTGCRQTDTRWQMCDVDDALIQNTNMERIDFQRTAGARFAVSGGTFKQVTFIDCEMPRLTLTQTEGHALSFVQSHLPQLQVENATIDDWSCVGSPMTASVWTRCTIRSMKCAQGSDLDGAHFSDCHIERATWHRVQASGCVVEHCKIEQLNAPRLMARESRWKASDLDAANLMHADLTGATFDGVSLRGAVMYAAQMADSRVVNCNLIETYRVWAQHPPARNWKRNLQGKAILLPEKPR